MNRHLGEILAGVLHGFFNRGRNLVGLAKTDSNTTFPVTEDDESTEAEAPSTLDDLGTAVDLYNALFIAALFLFTATASTARISSASPQTSAPSRRSTTSYLEQGACNVATSQYYCELLQVIPLGRIARNFRSWYPFFKFLNALESYRRQISDAFRNLKNEYQERKLRATFPRGTTCNSSQ